MSTTGGFGTVSYLDTPEGKESLREAWDLLGLADGQTITANEFEMIALRQMEDAPEIITLVQARRLRTLHTLLLKLMVNLPVDGNRILHASDLEAEQARVKRIMVGYALLFRLLPRIERKGRYYTDIDAGKAHFSKEDKKLWEIWRDENPSRELLERINEAKVRLVHDQNFDAAVAFREAERAITEALQLDEIFGTAPSP